MTEEIKQFLVYMYYPISLSKAIIGEYGINEEDVRAKIAVKYAKWVIEEVKEVE